jgi:hypothetical protein
MSVAFTGCRQEEPSIHGWNGIPWGASPEQVRRTYGEQLGALEEDKRVDGTVFYRIQGIRQAHERKYTARLFFDSQRRFDGVSLQPLPTGENCADLSGELTDLYGRPLRQNYAPDIDFHSYEWNDTTHGTRISLSDQGGSPNGLKPFCLVDYRPLPTHSRTGL